MNLFLVLTVFVVGAVIGSFFNAVLWRYGRRSLRERHSRCPKCRHYLYARDLVPLASYLFLRGRCRYCKRPIGFRYFVIELVCALAPLPLLALYGVTWSFLALSVLTFLFILLFVFDFTRMILPDAVTLPAFLPALAASLLLGRPVSSILIGGILGAAFFAVQYALSRGRWVGDGDIRLGAVMGVALGWKLLVFALFVSYMAGALIAVVLLLRSRATLKSAIPFGTLLTAATYATLLVGESAVDAYLRFIGSIP